MSDSTWKDDWAAVTHDTVRYADTDRQGHVNNAAFATFVETGRVRFLYDPERPVGRDGAEWVIVSLKLDFLGEIRWPGTVEIGTRVARIGTSSVTLEEGLYQDDRQVAAAETVIVQIDQATRKAVPLGPDAVARFEELRGG